MDPTRRFHIRTHGCQMNVHDSEKVGQLLAQLGYAASGDPDDADLLILNTCMVREKAEHRLYTELGRLVAWKERRAGRVIGVAGCVAQQQGDAILRRFGQVDFVYGTHNLHWVPALVAAAERGERHPDQASPTPGRAFVTVMEGCDMFCSFCVVPNTRGR